ncbi:histidine kinase [Armillaria luteobubalina]|uniref:Histidine kinase n=1 Tax=Armillaria luteobubalina TaxID=153913 RepID=A0AA39UME4_9AGAR|nr:histidine kinase [Armillaria luteobubalina]
MGSVHGLSLLPVLSLLPPGHPAAIYDVETALEDNVEPLPVWTNKAFDAFASDGILGLSPEGEQELTRSILLFSRTSKARGTPLSLSFSDGSILHASLQLQSLRWVILIGVIVAPVIGVKPSISPSALPMLDFAPAVRSTEVGRLVLDHDWASTPLGPMHAWPQSLKSVVSIMLSNPSQSCVFWGPDRILIYNEAWAKGTASKHTSMLGKPGRIAFSEIWDTFSKHCDAVDRGQTVSRTDDLLFFDNTPGQELLRSGSVPNVIEAYYTWSYIPVEIEDGTVGGIVNSCMETTRKVLSERHMKAVRALAERCAPARTSHHVWESVLDVLEENAVDFPYVLCYSGQTASSDRPQSPSGLEAPSERTNDDFIRTPRTTYLKLVGSIGIEPGHPIASPQQVELSSGRSEQGHWPFAEACADLESIRAQNPCPELFEPRGWKDPACDAILVPLCTSYDCVGLMVFGLNTRRPYDDDYSGFHHTIVRNLTAALSATQSFEQEVQRADELRALDRAKTMFFQNVSHELRTPLTLIRGPCDDALKADCGSLDPVNRTQFKLIYRASGRLLRLVNSLMLFSSAEARRLQACFCPVRLGPATADMASLFRSSIEKAGIDYNVTCGDSADERIAYIDLGMWEKIVFNLLSNAVKYTKSGHIGLDLTYTSSEVVLSVHDTGCGIPEDQLDKILLRFHRVETSDGRSIEGTGIGLALTNELVKMHQGTIHVRSTMGIGSVFTVRIPLGYEHLREKDVDHDFNSSSQISLPGTGSYAAGIVEEAAGWLAEDSDTSSQMSYASSTDLIMMPQRFTVLLAEDNADARSYIKSILLNAVQEVVDVSDGQAALDYIHSQKLPDLIVTDVMMPRMTGTELLQKLADDPDPNVQAIPAIVLTARTGSEDRPDSIFRGTVDFLLKPFSSSELLNRVRTRLHTLKQRQELEKQVRERTFELKLTQQRYQRMSELSPVAIFETDDVDHGLITYANERFFTLTALPRTLPLAFKSIIDRLTLENQTAATSVSQNVLIFNGEPVQFDAVFENGKNAFVEVIALSDGRLLGTLTDQTEQRRIAAEQLSEERAKADKAVHQRRLQEAFIDIVSHELRNPLSAIVQGAELLSASVVRLQEIIETLYTMNSNHDAEKLFKESDIELKDANHAVSSITLCARHQTIIAADILAVSRLDSNLLSVNPVTFHLLEELQATLDMYSVQAAAQCIDFKLSINGDIDKETCVIADPTRFCQILVNLISNSCRILESWEGERNVNLYVTISPKRPFGTAKSPAMKHDGNCVYLYCKLSDSGPGIPLDDQARLFTRFNDVHSGNGVRRSGSIGGTGLGLYLCKKLAELQGGQIRHSSSPGEGAAFHFFIEARKAPDAPCTGSMSPRRIVAKALSKTTNNVVPNGIAGLKNGSQLSLRTPSPSPSGALPLPPLSRAEVTVLIVEDNLINQMLLRRQLEKAGFSTATANNGLEALEYLESCVADTSKRYPSVVLMDLEMPILDGLDATGCIRDWEKTGRLPGPRLCVFAITGNARQGQVDAALGAGMNKVFIKPYKLAEIIEGIEAEDMLH